LKLTRLDSQIPDCQLQIDEAKCAALEEVKVAERRALEDIVACMQDLTDIHFPGAKWIRAVLDIDSTHTEAVLSSQ